MIVIIENTKPTDVKIKSIHVRDQNYVEMTVIDWINYNINEFLNVKRNHCWISTTRRSAYPAYPLYSSFCFSVFQYNIFLLLYVLQSISMWCTVIG